MNDSLEYGCNLVDQCNFDLIDPFDLNVEIIQHDSLPKVVIKQFKAHAYYNWLHFTYKGESEVAVCYKYLLDSIKKGKYDRYLSNFSSDKLNNFYDYLETTIAEETKHSFLWQHLVKKMYPEYKLIDLNDPDYINQMQSIYDIGLIKSLIIFFIGETVTLSTCSFLYQNTTNETKKSFLKIFLNEESKHLNGFSNLMRDIIANVNQDELNFAQRDLYPLFCGYDFDYFGLTNLPQLVGELGKNMNLSQSHSDYLEQKIYNNVKENLWQQKFNKFIMHKNFLYYKQMFPQSTEEDFNSLINSKWVKYQS